MITDDGVITFEDGNIDYNEVISWAHQCWQLHVLGNDIDLDEFKRRMNVNNIDYQKFMTDNEGKLSARPDTDNIYMLRVMNVLYPEQYPNAYKE